MKKLSVVSMMLFSHTRLWPGCRREEGGYGKPEGGRDACRRDVAIVLLNSTANSSRGRNEFRRPVPGPEGANPSTLATCSLFEHVHAEYGADVRRFGDHTDRPDWDVSREIGTSR